MRLYHNPRCSKSRQAFNLLKEREIEFEDYRYLDLGIHGEDIELLSTLDGIIRKFDIDKEIELAALKPREIQELLIQNPKFLQRPVLISNRKAIIGRPPENILILLP